MKSKLRKDIHYKQIGEKDCGPTCLKIVAKHYDKTIPVSVLRTLSETTRVGSSLLGLSDAAEKIGFRSLGVKITLSELEKAPTPCILHWNKNHFVVLYEVKNETFYISDPAHSILSYTKEELLKHWIGNNAKKDTKEGVALLLEPTPKFYDTNFEDLKESTLR